MTALNRFALDVLHDVTGAPVALVERDIRFTAIEYCDYTLAWRVSLADVAIVADTDEYTFAPPANSRVATVFYAAQDGIKIVPTTERVLDDTQASWRTQTSQQAAWYYLPDRETIRLALTPELADTLTLRVALKPTQDTKTLPDFLFNDHLEAIRAGTLARMLLQPGKDWSDPQLGTHYRALYEAAKRKERAERWNDYTRESTLSIRPINYYG